MIPRLVMASCLVLVSLAPAAAQGIPVERLFEKFLINPDSTIGKLIVSSGDSVYSLYCRAVRAAENEEKDRLFTRFLAKDPLLGQKQAYFNRGIARYHLDRLDKAIKDFTLSLTIDDSNVYAHYFRGNSYLNQKQYPEALEDFSACIKLDDSFHLGHYLRGVAYFELKEYRKAVKDFDTVIELSPKYDLAYFMRGMSHYRLEKQKKALEDWEKAIELNPAHMTKLGELYLKTKQDVRDK